MSITDQDSQRSQITKVISLGKEQKYLTYAQINDLLPNIVDTEHFDVIIGIVVVILTRCCLVLAS